MHIHAIQLGEVMQRKKVELCSEPSKLKGHKRIRTAWPSLVTTATTSTMNGANKVVLAIAAVEHLPLFEHVLCTSTTARL